MKKNSLQQLKARLLQEKKDLELRLQKLAGDVSNNEGQLPAWTDYGQKTDENAAEVAEFADEVSLQQSLQNRVQEIDDVLVKFNDKSYGTCSNCGNPIEEARLSAMPTATLCVNCSRLKK